MAMEVWLNLDGVNWASVISEPDGSFRVRTMLEYEGHSFDVASYEYRPGFFFENVPLTVAPSFSRPGLQRIPPAERRRIGPGRRARPAAAGARAVSAGAVG